MRASRAAPTSWSGAVRLEDARGFVFDVDGTLVHRAAHAVHPIPGALDVLARIEESGRPWALFTNGSHMPPAAFARELRGAGIPVSDEQMLTPLCSVQTYLERFREPHVLPFLTESARGYLEETGMRMVDGRNGGRVDAVFVAHADQTDFDELERAARAVIAGARLLTGSYVPAYAGASGPILSRGAMITAAIAKASSARPIIVGKPSQAAVRAMERHLGLPARDLVVVGDDVRLEVELGHMGGATTVLVRSGISGDVEVARLPEKRRPHLAVGTVAELLERL
jgi:HAD superfamily hydrolase (TIGR01450 family)